MIDHTRHMGIFNASYLDICLIGAGGIGAITAITLAKMGVNDISVFDADEVDEVNIATQFHRVSDVGLNKADAISGAASSYAGHVVSPYLLRVYNSTTLPPADIYISAVDSIASRQEIWQAVQGSFHRATDAWYIDARMGAEIYEQFTVYMKRPYWYYRSLSATSDGDFPDLPCTSKATIYTANIAAGHIGATVRRIITDQQRPGLLHHDILNNKLNFLDM